MSDSLTPDDVKEIARLARLQLRADEIESLRGELSAILEHVAALQELDTAEVEPMTHAVPMHLRLRPDCIADSLPTDMALDRAPDRADDHFQVPNIIKTSAGDQ